MHLTSEETQYQWGVIFSPACKSAWMEYKLT